MKANCIYKIKIDKPTERVTLTLDEDVF